MLRICTFITNAHGYDKGKTYSKSSPLQNKHVKEKNAAEQICCH